MYTELICERVCVSVLNSECIALLTAMGVRNCKAEVVYLVFFFYHHEQNAFFFKCFPYV